MNIDIKKSFFRDIKKISDPAIKAEIEQMILIIKKALAIKDIPRLKKLKGTRFYYRIRIGDYRIGVHIENGTVTFLIFMHRKDIYKYFP